MADIRITRLHPETGEEQVPVRERGCFVMGDPAHGKHKHHARHAVRVATLDEVLALLRRGFSLRMVAPGRRPSLVSRGLIVTIDGMPSR